MTTFYTESYRYGVLTYTEQDVKAITAIVRAYGAWANAIPGAKASFPASQLTLDAKRWAIDLAGIVKVVTHGQQTRLLFTAPLMGANYVTMIPAEVLWRLVRPSLANGSIGHSLIFAPIWSTITGYRAIRRDDFTAADGRTSELKDARRQHVLDAIQTILCILTRNGYITFAAMGDLWRVDVAA